MRAVVQPSRSMQPAGDVALVRQTYRVRYMPF